MVGLGFNWPDWVLLSLAKFKWVLTTFVGFLAGLPVLHWVLAGFQWVFTRFYLIRLGLTGFE